MVRGERPQIGFISILHTIKDIYQRYEDIDTEDNLENLIFFYEKKETYTDIDLQKLEVRCIQEWQKILVKLCGSIIKKVGENQKRKKLFKTSLRKAERLRIKIEENNLGLEVYERIFYEEIEKLKDDFEASVLKEKMESGRFLWGLFIGFILGVIGSYLVTLYTG